VVGSERGRLDQLRGGAPSGAPFGDEWSLESLPSQRA